MLAVRLPSSLSQTIENLVAGAVVWLHVRAGASRFVANTMLAAIQVIVTVIFKVLQTALAAHGVTLKIPGINIPVDIRTAYSRHFSEPKITRHRCCPVCFKMFPRYMPKTCDFKPSPRAKMCGAVLWKQRRTRKGFKSVPVCSYTTQDPESWFQFFLGRKIIDDALQATYRKQVEEPREFGSEMKDTQDSPAFCNLFNDQPSPYNLIFGIYVDWFLAFKMKIGGTSRNVYWKSLLKHYYREKGIMWTHLSVLP